MLFKGSLQTFNLGILITVVSFQLADLSIEESSCPRKEKFEVLHGSFWEFLHEIEI